MATHRGDGGQPGDDRAVEVDDDLESRIFGVESAVVTYLVRITDESRSALMAALQAIDDQTAASTDFRARTNAVVVPGAVAGLGSSALDVVGQTTRYPIVVEVPRSVFQAQVALVRAAKDEVLSPSPATLDALTAANGELAAMRSRHVDGSSQQDRD